MFPLSTVLFPGLTVPLHVFEERYRQLVRDICNSHAYQRVSEPNESNAGDRRNFASARVRRNCLVGFADMRCWIGGLDAHGRGAGVHDYRRLPRRRRRATATGRLHDGLQGVGQDGQVAEAALVVDHPGQLERGPPHEEPVEVEAEALAVRDNCFMLGVDLAERGQQPGDAQRPDRHLDRHHRVPLRVNGGAIQRLLPSPDPQEAGGLLEGLRPDAGDLEPDYLSFVTDAFDALPLRFREVAEERVVGFQGKDLVHSTPA